MNTAYLTLTKYDNPQEREAMLFIDIDELAEDVCLHGYHPNFAELDYQGEPAEADSMDITAEGEYLQDTILAILEDDIRKAFKIAEQAPNKQAKFCYKGQLSRHA